MELIRRPKIFLPSFILFLIGLIIPFAFLIHQVTATAQNFIVGQQLYYRQLPSDWLVGQVLNVGPSAQFETRYGTDFKDLTVGATIGLGDDIKTDSDASSIVSVKFDLADFTVNPDTRLKFANTSPSNFLISLNRGGSFDFTSSENKQFSVVSLHLLSQFNSAAGSIQTIGNNITIKLTSGSVNLAFNDTDLKTQNKTISAPQKIIFNDSTRNLKLKKL